MKIILRRRQYYEWSQGRILTFIRKDIWRKEKSNLF